MPEFITARAKGILLRRVTHCQRLVLEAVLGGPESVVWPTFRTISRFRAFRPTGQGAAANAILRRENGGVAGQAPPARPVRGAGKRS